MKLNCTQLHIGHALYHTVSLLLLASVTFLWAEPIVSSAQTNTFTVRQLVTGEISFTATSSNVTMVGPLTGITGGTSTGSTVVAVQTNSATGYTMDISFSNSPGMRGETTGSTAIRNYATSSAWTGEPSFGFFASTSAQFAYTVNASTTTDVDQSFLNNGVGCNAGSTFTVNACWTGATSTGNFRIINRGTAATTSATTTLNFRVTIPNNPIPAVQSDFYTATATLTALTQ